jgi:hypothetical protein
MGRLQALCSVAFTGAWLALLSDRWRFAIDQEYYGGEAMYRSATYNESGLLEWERAAIDAHFRGCRTVLVPAAGGGREVLSLRREGFEVEAFECHPEFVRVANELLQRHGLGQVSLAPRDTCPAFGRCFDGAIVGWGAYMLIRGRARRVQFLRQLRAQLAPCAPILLSFYAQQTGYRRLWLAARIGNALAWLSRGEPVELGDYLVPNFVHFFTEQELASELCDSGFELAEFRANPYGHAVAHAV